MNREDFEQLLDVAASRLTEDVRADRTYHSAAEFEKHTLAVLLDTAKDRKLQIDPAFNPQGFPDIVANGFGVEVKSVQTDSWLTIGNSIFEGTREAEQSAPLLHGLPAAGQWA